jgi:hypothetical protein
MAPNVEHRPPGIQNDVVARQPSLYEGECGNILDDLVEEEARQRDSPASEAEEDGNRHPRDRAPGDQLTVARELQITSPRSSSSDVERPTRSSAGGASRAIQAHSSAMPFANSTVGS